MFVFSPQQSTDKISLILNINKNVWISQTLELRGKAACEG